MKFLKKYSFWIICISIFVLYFVTRFYNLLGLPIFTDEAIYVRWAQIASNDASWRFISLTDGKQPMFVWVAMLLMKVIHDPLLAGRVVSVLAGVGTMIGLFFLTNEVFKDKKIALLVSFLYVIYPFSLVYDRMALYESLVSMFIVWSLYFEILLVRFIRLDLAMILGAIIGFGMLTKTSIDYAFALIPFLLLLFDFKKSDWKKRLGRLIIYSVVAAVIANGFYMILRLSPFFYIIAQKNYVFLHTPKEMLANPFGYFLPNLRPLVQWLAQYMTIPFLLLVVASFLVSKKFVREKLLLLAWFVVPFLVSTFIARLLYPRYILSMTLPLLILGGCGLYYAVIFAKKMWLQAVVIVVFLLMFVINDYYIITNFAKASVPNPDRGQYLTAWPSGVGVRETVAFLKKQSEHQKIYVATEGTFGLMPYALEMYFVNNPNIIIKGFWPVENTLPQEVIDVSRKMPTYFVFYQPCVPCSKDGVAPVQWNVKPIFQIQRLENVGYYSLYQVNPQ